MRMKIKKNTPILHEQSISTPTIFPFLDLEFARLLLMSNKNLGY